jgi:hypothetical protein
MTERREAVTKTVQTKFFEELERRAKTAGLEVVVSYSASNVGTLYLQKPLSFETKLVQSFNFQPGSASFKQPDGVGRDLAGGVFQGRPNPSNASFTPDQLGEAISAMMAAAGR